MEEFFDDIDGFAVIGDPIRFDSAARLIDGQHRVDAFAERRFASKLGLSLNSDPTDISDTKHDTTHDL